jgi:GNAT superfamily N-acetyltransferase
MSGPLETLATMSPRAFTTRALDESAWPDFAALVERHNGVWGGCWCMEFHAEGAERSTRRREMKACRVREGAAHAALVYAVRAAGTDAPGSDTAAVEACVGWCQFGSPAELPRIKHKRAYEADLERLPDWRITCFFVDKAHRGQGVASAALDGALGEIARLGGGVVESYPEHGAGRKVSSSFLHNGSVSLFERHGFARVRQLGKNHWVVARSIDAPK